MSRPYLFVGDTHGDLEFIEEVAAHAALVGAEIIQVGDWGFLWPGADQLATLDLILTRAGEREGGPPVTMRFLDGNHDDHPRLRAASGNRRRASMLTGSVIYQPRGSVHEDEDGTRFLFLGGAPSIDRAVRTPGRSWWPEETIIPEDVEAALAVAGPIHVLCTHDAPAYPPGFGLVGRPSFDTTSMESQAHVARVLAHHQPELHVHGHWHKRYQAGVTVGLASNFDIFEHAVMPWRRTP